MLESSLQERASAVTVCDSAQEQSRSGRALVNGAFVLAGPGTYIERHPQLIIVGNRPTPLLWGATLFIWCVTLSVGWLFWPQSRVIALLPSLVMGFPPVLALLNRQRWEITPQTLRMRGRALGMATHRDYALGCDSRVRLANRSSTDGQHAIWQVQIHTVSGDWLGVAESRERRLVMVLAEEINSRLGISLAELE